MVLKQIHKATLSLTYRTKYPLPTGHWKLAVVVRIADTARSYHIQTPDGAEYRRNRHHLLDTKDVPITSTDVNTNVQGASDIAHPAPAPHAPKAVTYFTRSGREVRPRDILDL